MPQEMVETMTTSLPRVRVLGLHPVEHPHVLISADVELGNSLILRGVTAFLDPQTGVPCVRPPQFQWTDDTGERRYYTPCRFRKPLRTAILTALLAKYHGGGES